PGHLQGRLLGVLEVRDQYGHSRGGIARRRGYRGLHPARCICRLPPGRGPAEGAAGAGTHTHRAVAAYSTALGVNTSPSSAQLSVTVGKLWARRGRRALLLGHRAPPSVFHDEPPPTR